MGETSYWLTEDFCRKHGRKGYTQLLREFPDVGAWNGRRARMRALWPDLVPLLDTQSRPVGLAAPDQDCPVDSDELKRLLAAGPCDVVSLANHFGCAPRVIDEAVEHLRARHLLIADTAAGLTFSSEIAPLDAYRIDTLAHQQQEFCIGLTADNHIGSKYERLDVLGDLFDRWESYGVTDVYCAGNYIDGSGRKFNQHDIYVHGVDNQIENFLAKWPRKEGIRSHILSGDDHEGWFVQDAHVNIGHVLESEARLAGREDIFDLGYMERDLEFAQPDGSASIRIAHMGGGTGYALSYSMQKYAESLQGGEKPQIVVGGHYHKFDYNYAREIHLLQPGCTCDQTPFMRKKKLQAMVGGCALWLKQNELGIFTSVKVEWMPYYDRRYYAYQWRGDRGTQ